MAKGYKDFGMQECFIAGAFASAENGAMLDGKILENRTL